MALFSPEDLFMRFILVEATWVIIAASRFNLLQYHALCSFQKASRCIWGEMQVRKVTKALVFLWEYFWPCCQPPKKLRELLIYIISYKLGGGGWVVTRLINDEEIFRDIHLKAILLLSHRVVSDSLRPHGLQHTRLLYPSASPAVCPSSRPWNQWFHPTISSSVLPADRVGGRRWFNGHEFEQTLGDSEGQGSLACCSPLGCKSLAWLVTEQHHHLHNDWPLLSTQIIRK